VIVGNHFCVFEDFVGRGGVQARSWDITGIGSGDGDEVGGVRTTEFKDTVIDGEGVDNGNVSTEAAIATASASSSACSRSSSIWCWRFAAFLCSSSVRKSRIVGSSSIRMLRASHPRSVGNGVISEGRLKVNRGSCFVVLWDVTMHTAGWLVQHFLHILRLHKQLQRRVQFCALQDSAFLAGRA